MDLQPPLLQGQCEWQQIVQQRFTSRDDGNPGTAGSRSPDNITGSYFRMLLFIPAIFHITPPALDITAGQTNKVGGTPGMKTLSLDSVEILHQRIPDTLRLLTLQDRKSTRLNSSHVAISYAVFC